MAETVAVRVGQSADISKVVSAIIFHKAFLKLGKRSDFNLPKEDTKTKEFLGSIFDSLENAPANKRLVVKLDTADTPISEMKYEKEGSVLKIILESKDT